MSAVAWHRILKLGLVFALWVGVTPSPANTASTRQPGSETLYLPCLARDADPRYETEPNGTEGRADVLLGSAIDHFGFHNTGPQLDSDYWRFTTTAPGLMHLHDDSAWPYASQRDRAQRRRVEHHRAGSGRRRAAGRRAGRLCRRAAGYAGGPPYVITATLTTVDTYVVRVVSTRALDTGVYTLTVTYP